jgi:hypothetical protein
VIWWAIHSAVGLVVTLSDIKPPKREDKIQSGLGSQTAKEFADVVADVLLEWGFPGQNKVFFDPGTCDLVIDGKERRHNGKGVRAIKHAAFKVALLLYCRARKLPHPGFLVLDTPLLTYRDPMKKPGDKLTTDEEELRNTDLKERFFEHLGHIGTDAQFMIFENVDPRCRRCRLHPHGHLRRTPTTTIKLGLISPWARTHRLFGRSNGSALSSLGQPSGDYTITIVGRSSR